MHMSDFRLYRALLPLLVFVGVTPAAAQLPWADGWDRDQDNARYSAEVFRTVNETMSDWRDAWSAEWPEGLARFYAREAVVTLPDGSRVLGPSQVETAVVEIFPSEGDLETGIDDFALGGTLAYSMGWFRYTSHPAGGELYEQVGTHVVVFRRHGRRWLIHRQAFLPSSTREGTRGSRRPS